VLYGMTGGGGGVGCVAGHRLSCGTVFKLTPPGAPGTRWRRTVLYRFHGRDGQLGGSDLPVPGEDGSLYGTAAAGDSPSCFGGTGCGTVFKLTPGGPGAPWTETNLHRFQGAETVRHH
jgi:hypothetical protein